MTEEQVSEAIEQMKAHCELLMADYEMVSARSALIQLGYHDEDLTQVLQNIFDRGFTHCLDSNFGSPGSLPNPDVCFWGPDQLRSRLESLS